MLENEILRRGVNRPDALPDFEEERVIIREIIRSEQNGNGVSKLVMTCAGTMAVTLLGIAAFIAIVVLDVRDRTVRLETRADFADQQLGEIKKLVEPRYRGGP